MSKAVENFIGLWLFLMTLALGLAVVLYMFSDGSEDVVEELTLGTVYHARPQLGKFIQRGASGKDSFIDALEDNKLVSDIELDAMDASELLLEKAELPYFFGQTGSNLDEVDDYFEAVRLTFTYNNKKQVTADFIVLKGKLFFFIGDNKLAGMKPWAQFVTIDRLKVKAL